MCIKETYVTQMLFGLVLGYLYAKYGFGSEGETPKIDCSCGPIRYGRLYVCEHRIHHWMVTAPLAVISFNLAVFIPYAGFLGCWDLMTFCTVMTFHGLSYSDRCDTQVKASDIQSIRDSEIETESEVESESEP